MSDAPESLVVLPGGLITAYQLQRLGLPGLPRRQSDINRKAVLEGIPRRPHPCRRAAFAYATSDLPKAACEALMQRFPEAFEGRSQLAGSGVVIAAPAVAPGEAAPAPVAPSSEPVSISPPSREVEKIDMPAAPAAEEGWRQRRRRRGCAIERDAGLKSYVVGLLGHKPHIKASHMAQAIAVDQGRQIDLRTVQRFLKRWKAENAVLYAYLEDPDRAKGKYQPAQGSQTAHLGAVNELWELDTTPADVMLKDGRHHVIGCIDLYSRRMRLLVVPISSAEGVVLALRDAIEDWGVPKAIRTDNGRDYKSTWMNRVCASLGIERDFGRPYRPEDKSTIERALGIFSHDIVELLPGYIGHNVAQREAIRNRRSFAQRLARKGDVVDLEMDAEGFQDACDKWLAIYNGRPHSNFKGKLKGLSPQRAALASPGAVKRVESTHHLDLLLAPAPDNNGRRRVGKEGIKVAGRQYIARELAAHQGETVNVRYHPQRLGAVAVWDVHCERLICYAENAELMEHARRAEIAIEAKAVHREKVRDGLAPIRAAGKAHDFDGVGLRMLDAGSAEASNVVGIPRRSLKHQTRELEALEQAARAAEPPPMRYEPDGRPITDDPATWATWALANRDKLSERDLRTLAGDFARKSFRVRMEMETPDWLRPLVDQIEKERAAS